MLLMTKLNCNIFITTYIKVTFCQKSWFKNNLNHLKFHTHKILKGDEICITATNIEKNVTFSKCTLFSEQDFL